MIKRVIYNSETGSISGFLPTDIETEFCGDEGQLYCSVEGTETSVNDLSGAQELILAKTYEDINSKTEELINNGIEYKGTRFWCDQTAQQNYTGLWLKRDSEVTYPYTIWDGTGSVQITGSDEMDVFCTNLMKHVETQRVTGKTIRDTVSGNTAVELLNFVDPRG